MANLSGRMTWVLAVLSGAIAMVVIEALVTGDPAMIRPWAQAGGFFIASLVAWPYTHRRYPRLTLWRYALSSGVPIALIAVLRIAFRTG